MISSIRMVYSIVDHGRPAVRRRSKSNKGVVITLGLLDIGTLFLLSNHLPVDVSNIEDLTHSAGHPGIGSPELWFNTGLSKVGAHGKISDGSNQCDCCGDVVEDTVRTGLGEREPSEGEGRNEHHSADGLYSLAWKYDWSCVILTNNQLEP